MSKLFWLKKTAVLLIALFFTALTVTAVAALGDFRSTCEDISEKVLRFHVLANSDSEADQQLKLKVRDAILQESDRLFSTSETKAQAMAAISDQTGAMEAIAERTLQENGCDLPVTAEVTKVYFNTRTYGDVTLPAGYYDALQIRIGAAAGHNWWCVLFPSLCLPASTNVQMDDVLTEEELEVVAQSGYDVRFKVVEWYEAVAGWFR